VAELSAACVRFVATRYGVMLDFRPETLSLLDQYVADARKEIDDKNAQGDAAGAEGAAVLVATAAGAYLGEVIRHELGGMWFAEGEEYDTYRLDMETVFLSFNPIGMMREALLLGEAEGWHAHLVMDPAERDVVQARLAALPAVEDTEYYAPTTRYEAVTIAVDALRTKMIEEGHGDVRFGPDDYKR
jgi:hypothetical protein